MRRLLKKYPLSCLCIALIWVLCFCTPPQTPLDGVQFMDKWVHTIMYLGTCLVIWIEYLRVHRTVEWKRLLTLSWVALIAMSGLIGLLQAYCTGGRRSGDWLDFAANSIGATLALLIGCLLARCRPRQRRGKQGGESCRNGCRP